MEQHPTAPPGNRNERKGKQRLLRAPPPSPSRNPPPPGARPGAGPAPSAPSGAGWRDSPLAGRERTRRQSSTEPRGIPPPPSPPTHTHTHRAPRRDTPAPPSAGGGRGSGGGGGGSGSRLAPGPRGFVDAATPAAGAPRVPGPTWLGAGRAAGSAGPLRGSAPFSARSANTGRGAGGISCAPELTSRRRLLPARAGLGSARPGSFRVGTRGPAYYAVAYRPAPH